jgi:hypothetical protein
MMTHTIDKQRLLGLLVHVYLAIWLLFAASVLVVIAATAFGLKPEGPEPWLRIPSYLAVALLLVIDQLTHHPICTAFRAKFIERRPGMVTIHIVVGGVLFLALVITLLAAA